LKYPILSSKNLASGAKKQVKNFTDKNFYCIKKFCSSLLLQFYGLSKILYFREIVAGNKQFYKAWDPWHFPILT